MPTIARLSPVQVRTRLDRLAAHLSTKDQHRIAIVKSLFDDSGNLHLTSVLRTLAPGKPRKRRVAALKRLRDNLLAAAEISGESIILKFDEGRPPKLGTDDLQCWFEGEIESEKARRQHAARHAAPAACRHSKARFDQGRQVIDCVVLTFGEGAMWTLHQDLLQRLLHLLSKLARFQIHFSYVTAVHCDIDWRKQTRSALSRCQIGLLLLDSDLVRHLQVQEFQEKALATFVAHDGHPPMGNRRMIPIVLTPLRDDNGRSDLRGIDPRPLFFGHANGQPIAYSQCDHSHARDEFASQLCERIERYLELQFGS